MSLSPEHERELERRKLESLAEFAAGAGHEINNPLATIAGRVQLLLRTETDPEKRRALETIGGQAYRIRDMIGDVMLFARPPTPCPAVLDLTSVAGAVLEEFADAADAVECDLRIDAPAAVPIRADENQLKIVLESLLRNALEAGTTDPRIVVACRSIDDSGARCAELTVTDNGRGLSDLEREHLFDPFFSGRQAGRGLGFGLSKCWRIVSNHGGRIDVDSVPGGDTIFRVVWPAPAEGQPHDVD